MIRRVDEAEVDEMWSFVGKKQEQRWLWHAIDHRTGEVAEASDVTHTYQASGAQDDLLLKSIEMHDIISGLFVNRDEFGLSV